MSLCHYTFNTGHKLILKMCRSQKQKEIKILFLKMIHTSIVKSKYAVNVKTDINNLSKIYYKLISAEV